MRGYISSLEQGRRNPTIVTLYEFAMALGVRRNVVSGIRQNMRP
jgi:transcriptional regulator with XRE-family HTH domain